MEIEHHLPWKYCEETAIEKRIQERFKSLKFYTKPWWLSGSMCQDQGCKSGHIHAEIWSVPIFKVVMFGQE